MLNELKRLMLCRIIILSSLLAITFLFQVSEKKFFFIPLIFDFYYFIGLFYLVTILYALLLKRIRDLFRFTVIQIVVDLLFITGLIYFTGGKESYFPIIYIFSIIGGSILFSRRGAFFLASLSSLFYGLLLVLQLYQWIHPPGQSAPYEPSQIFYSLVVYMAAFYIVAVLSSTISEELQTKKKELFQKEADYQQLETFNRNIIQSLDSGLLTIDMEGRINSFNRTAEKILQFNGDDPAKRSIFDLFPGIDEVIDRIKTKPSNPSVEYERYERIYTNPEGLKTHLGFSISPLPGSGESWTGYTLIFRDITRFKEMEEQMKRSDKMAAIGQLAAGMAHEIRNPLASLGGSIQVLKSELVLDDGQQRLMEIVLRESERLNALITDFLLFAQPPRTNKRAWRIGEIIGETIDLFTHAPEYHDGIRILRPLLHEDIPVMIDADQMKQVLWNLMVNAAQEMSQGGELRIHLEKRTDAPSKPGFSARSTGKTMEWLALSVSDSGRGIPAQEKEKIFEPFYTTKDRGTGLGLSIVHKIIENHNGAIKVESEMGRGTIFTLYLPME
jgi:two-component system, NtrC family, sensor histidine kinase PilS